jgi:uncharacterized membrane protein YoaT (DUF817 family)
MAWGRHLDFRDWIKAKVAALDAAARPWAAKSRLNALAYEFLLFGLKQAWACLFGGALVFLLVATHLFWPAHSALARYDFLVIAALAIQVLMLALKLEHWDEAAVILIFHVVGTGMEIFKTAHGSWIYPEHSLLRIGGVPLFSGFMYAAIGSYIARTWRMFDIRFSYYPPIWATWVLAVASYVNFFSHHYLPDIRIGLFALSAVLYGPGVFYFTADIKPRRMPMLLGLVLVSLFIWFAENAGTFANAWTYPAQRAGWHIVPFEKLGAWYLLMILSIVLVTVIRKPEVVGKTP